MIIILCLSSAQGLTIDDFYTDTNAQIVETVTSSTSSFHTLPIPISNLRGNPRQLRTYNVRCVSKINYLILSFAVL